ncbi:MULTISPECIES: sulfite reductase flavoprotein subunit alpha [unclassified Pseudomonas]|uniref:PepSY domain-containing protein n=1 Tax=unclassified Pseudomonas TaxID=196821 RepID=UPI000BDB5C9F|nr:MULTISPECIES: sulfite reductase flavoprotein subunit alpha [unclassified Pseudomonas]PVZ12378.1 sulfite reductase (NADPH) flavoprotein alpha-component [Pseudomonas sp. URIL14HWK12:I12]PVZ23470.1 sulfite reductase (NADPH) flavoprotein alpha-component [Pseudomonas sp. URIL14HWK12:I10]PVZ32800.1 sulfite reductase (NADPH) flavoprotein alpha-component [Pseudomonas sp. URIL14HWK12:I11]SNZ14126.1 sulfite reductase (NADPH) flavoprotein alpha-component [Pseudomonas sp. URIL14HWK12:I9]
MFKKVLFQLHWFFGITAGLVLALMGITGALYSFQDEILRTLNPDTLKVQPRPEGPLPLGRLVDQLQQVVGKEVVALNLEVTTGEASRAYFMPEAGQRRGELRYFNSYTGALTGEVRGEAFFRLMLDLHRFLAIGDTGRQITGACTLALLFFCFSGLYLRWPRRPLNWRAWLALDWAKKGRAFQWDLHAVFGTWCLVVYLLSATTGLTWSYAWFRDGAVALLSSDQPQQRPAERRDRPGNRPAEALQVDFTAIDQAVRQAAGPDLASYTLRLPARASGVATVFYLLSSSPNDRAFNQLQLTPTNGALRSHATYAQKALGDQLLTSLYALHVGSYFGLPGRLIITLASLCMPLFFVTGWLLYLDRRRKQRLIRHSRQGLDAASEGWLIGFASQSGQAEQLAWQAAAQLQAGGIGAKVRALGTISESDLKATDRALFVVSTFGDGEAPDSARLFERQMAALHWPLPHLRYGLLALGDRNYTQFCGFARSLDAWLSAQGATPLFERIEVDNHAPAALAQWAGQVAAQAGGAAVLAHPERFSPWTLAERRLLNPGSAGAPVYHLRLVPEGLASWSAGDIAEILPGPGADAAQAREYSIASLPADGGVELLVRQHRHADGSLGLGSGWLTEHAALGGTVQLHLRRNSAFHAPDDDRPLILIGNGTGLAGLRSLLRQREVQGHARNWLLFGERNRAHDLLLGHELEGWLARGHLQRLDLAFSRDQAEKVYVQSRLREAAEPLLRWLAEGAALYVCGSLQGMADGVDRTLRELLGEAAVQHLIEQGRYRRDVY